MQALLCAQDELPKRLKDFFVDYRGSVPEDALSDQAFEFRVQIREYGSTSADADYTIEYVRWSDLSTQEQDAYVAGDKARGAIVHEKIVRVPDERLWMSPTQMCDIIEDELQWRFAPATEFPKSWNHFNVRPGPHDALSRQES